MPTKIETGTGKISAKGVVEAVVTIDGQTFPLEVEVAVVETARGFFAILPSKPRVGKDGNQVVDPKTNKPKYDNMVRLSNPDNMDSFAGAIVKLAGSGGGTALPSARSPLPARGSNVSPASRVPTGRSTPLSKPAVKRDPVDEEAINDEMF